MSWARDEVLFRAQWGLLGLRAVHNLVFRERPGESPAAVQRATFDLVRALVDDGLVVIGDRTAQGFVPWTVPVGEGLDRINDDYAEDMASETVGGFDPPSLKLTEAGRQAARAVPIDTGATPDDAVRQWDWPLPEAARKVLGYGTVDWIELGQIHWRVKEVSEGEPAEVLQQRTLELIADLVRGGLAAVGSFGSGAAGFVPWASSLDETLSRIASEYVDKYDDPNAWEWSCLLELTRKGQLLATALETEA
jgi:hypothetical protein